LTALRVVKVYRGRKTGREEKKRRSRKRFESPRNHPQKEDTQVKRAVVMWGEGEGWREGKPRLPFKRGKSQL